MSGEGDHYEILGVKRTATQAEIHAAYKQKARELHPDVNKAPDAEERFKRLAAAYAVLKDEEKRAKHDRERRERSDSSRGRARPGPTYTPRDFGFGDVRFEDVKLGADEHRNPFEAFLGREKKRREQRSGEREVALTIGLEAAFKGTTLNMLLDLPDETGRSETRRIRIKIPRGAKEGDRLKLKDPEVTVVLRVEPHPRFTLSGRELTTTLDVSPWEIALGAVVELDAPGGAVKVRIPEGTPGGSKLRLKGHGLPLKPGREGEPGDLMVTLRVVVPRNLSERERELFEALRRESGFDPRAPGAAAAGTGDVTG